VDNAQVLECGADRAGMGKQRPSRLWLVWLTVGCLVAGGYLLLPSGQAGTAVYYTAFTLACNVMLFVGIRINRPPRPALWYLFLAGQTLWCVGDGLYAFYQHVLGLEPYPSAADGLYLAGYPWLVAALLILIRSRTKTPDRSGLIDACVVATGLTLLTWTYVIRPLTEDSTLTLPERTISVAYPAGDVLLLVMATRLFTTRGVRTMSYWLLTTALLLVLAADAAWSGVFSMDGAPAINAVMDIGWMLSYLAWSAAALHPSMVTLSLPRTAKTVRFTTVRLTMLAAASLLAPAVLIAQGITDPTNIDWPAIGAGAVVLFLLVVARMSGLVSQIQDQAAQLAALAHKDWLTGVPNRRAWDLELNREISRARRTGGPVVVALLDLDHFKLFNDAHGHQAGDQVLREAATAWQARMRAGDLLARYGGEEFGVIITGVPVQDAAEIVGRLRELTPMGQTFSAGIARWDGEETAQQLVARADAALYEAKRRGRNQVTVDAPVRLAVA
jgi:diguanylate cyclase (GGDEF)-like protein